MRPEERDPAHLWDILEAAESILSFTRGQTFQQFVEDAKTRLAVERELEIIGEAARRISHPLREQHPEIPWKDLIGLRNVISHEYDKIDYTQVYAIARRRIPELIDRLKPLVPQPPETTGR
jgi:uncharacterized protein with HEPN domain